MTTVLIDLRIPAGTGTDTAATRVLVFTPWGPGQRRTLTDHITLPDPFDANLTDGQATVVLAPTEATWCWKVQECTERTNTSYPNDVTRDIRYVRYVTVPDSVTDVLYGDLVDVDPETLLPSSEPSAAWQAELDALQAEVAAALGDDANFASTVATALAGKVAKTGNETIDGTKTFSSAPVVPTPTADSHAVTKAYVDGAPFQPAGSYVTSAAVASFPVWCIWTGSAWTTLAGSAVPTDTELVRVYDSVGYATAGVTAPTAYNAHDKWWQEPA